MTQQEKSAGFGAGVLATLLAFIAIALIVIYTGAYNVAATEDHTSLTRWAFETTMHNSVETRASDIQAPDSFSERSIAAGAAEYKAMCEHCHAGPGVDRAEWAKGMLPLPPHLADEAAEWSASEIFWLVKHGVKLSGMPAFGPTHGDETLWNIVAFVEQLPGMTAQEYAAFEGEHGGHSGGHSH